MSEAPQLIPAPPDQRTVIGRLLQLYLHDFSEYATAGSPYGTVDEAGLFPYPYLDLYWREPGRLPFLIRTGGRIAGFVLVNQWFASGQPGDHCVAEFFILRKYRRTGLGTAAARALFAMLPGTWEIPVAHYNAAAHTFWRHVLANRAFTQVPGDGERWGGPILGSRQGRSLFQTSVRSIRQESSPLRCSKITAGPARRRAPLTFRNA